jgi:N-acyl-D-amino-acid deacylase
LSIDYLLKEGLIIDGTADDASPVRADIAIEGDCIREIGDLSHIDAVRTINVKGLCICPGFIDVHAHSEFILLADGRAQGKISQGITTEINGNCGLSAAPLEGPAAEQRENDLDEINIKERWRTFSEYFRLLEERKFAVNFITLVGHGNLRASVAGYTDKSLSDANMEKITELLTKAMSEGAIGLSTGLVYPPGIYSGTSEIIDLAREVAKHKGIYTTHMRSEGDELLESVDEVINIAGKSKIHAHISHLKTSGKKNWEKLDGVFEKINLAHKEGLSLTCDRYPYTASSTDLDTILPSWAFEGGRKKEIARLKTDQKKLSDDILKDYQQSSDWDNVIISSVSLNKNKWMEGKSILEISGYRNKTALQNLFDILIEEDLNVGAIFFKMNEDNLKSILKRSYAVIGTDSAARSFDGITAKGMPHPRGFGAFPKVLGQYVREQCVITLSEAIYKMTGLPAKIFQINRRGILEKDYFADITVFDPDKVNDVADFNNPFQRPEGIYHVFVNGVPVLLDGETTGALPGRILR